MAFYVVQRMRWLPESFPNMIRIYKDLLHLRWLNSLSKEERREYLIAKQHEEERARESLMLLLNATMAITSAADLRDTYEAMAEMRKGRFF